MKALLPLIESMISRLEGDGLLATYMGGTATAYAWEAPDNQAMPYITISPISMTDWSAGSFDGDDVLLQVAAHFERGKASSAHGIQDVSKAAERIRDILANADGFDLNESPSEGESLVMDFLTGPMRVEGSTDKRLVLCRYVSGAIIPGLNDAARTQSRNFSHGSISGVSTFRALVSPS